MVQGVDWPAERFAERACRCALLPLTPPPLRVIGVSGNSGVAGTRKRRSDP